MEMALPSSYWSEYALYPKTGEPMFHSLNLHPTTPVSRTLWKKDEDENKDEGALAREGGGAGVDSLTSRYYFIYQLVKKDSIM